MGTPLKTISAFLSPRNTSKLSPRFLSLPKVKLPKSEVQQDNKSKVVRTLFPNSTADRQFLSPVKITVTHYEETLNKKDRGKGLLLNTPIKCELMKNGLENTKILNILGKGTFGTVFRGIYKDESIAVKLVEQKDAIREKNALHLNHKNITKTIEIIENVTDNFSLVLMEYLPDAINLQFMLENLDIDIKNKVLKFACGITEGLEFCHQNNVLHLDLKPRNILVVNSNQCKICDFGNSVNIRKCNELKNTYKNKHHGTVAYTAPEMFLGKQPTTKCDIYSLGIVFWQLENRKNPYSDIDNMETIIYKVVKNYLRPACNATNMGKLAEIYTRCWSDNIFGRPEATDILLHLKKL